jgi:hypothetical protein
VEYKNLIRDFAQRTLKNLERVEAAVKQDPQSDIFDISLLLESNQ